MPQIVADSRVQEYARLLVERSIDVQPGWQVMVISQPAARPLLEEVVRLIGSRKAYPIVRFSYAMEQLPFNWTWAKEAPLELLETVAPVDQYAWDNVDAWMLLGAPENPRTGADVPAEKREALNKAHAKFLQRRLRMEIPWVTCRFPCPALAQEAGLTNEAFEDFLYGAVLLDWDAEGEKMKRIKDRFDRADEVRIVGAETDLRFSLVGREGEVDDGHANMPGGEVFYSPVEDSTEGTVSFIEYPAYQEPDLVDNVRMRYEGGKVVEASATSNEEALFAKARPRRGRADPRRVRDRLQPRHPALHEEHALRREDVRDDPPRGRRRLAHHRRQERQRRALGHGQRPAQRRPHRMRRRDRPGKR